MSRRTRHIAIFLLGTLVFSSYALAATTGTAVIAGTEQITAGIWDFGTVTVTVNNYSESVPYGQYSTPDSLASAIAAKFSSDCNGPANARSAPGGVINFRMRHSANLTQLNVSVSSSLSFSGTPNSLLTIPTTTTATIGATVVAPGQSTAVDVQVSCDSACGMVDYQIDHTEWATVALDGSGHFTANTSSSLAAGLHNVVVKFQGGGMYISSTSNPVSFTVSSGTGGSSPIYSYSISNSSNIPSYTPNGNVSAYTDTVNGGWSNIGYDGLNRLTTATYSPGVGSTQYMCWGYDSFGNRTYQTVSPTPCSGSAPSTPLQYDAGNHLSGIAYDASGNVTNDGTNQYLYDAEGRVCAMQSSTSGARVQYIYDAEGQRVAKGSITSWSCDTTSNGFTETSGYVLGPNGEQVTEVDGQGNWVHTNVYAAGQLIATYQNDQQGVHFHLSDWLGTLHVQTDYAGNRESTYQNLPFGELIPPNQSLGATEQFFTGKERDQESGLDYFGARYYGSNMGRWMSPDPSNLGVDIYMPQTWNRYNYAVNNPLAIKDGNGLWPFYVHDQIINESFPGMSKQDLQSLKNASWNMDFGPGQQDPSNAYQHGMQDGSGDVGGNPYYMQQLAHQEADDFISQQVTTAQQAQVDWEAQGHTGIAPAAMTAFGNALHTVTDRTSPSHQGEQPWANKPWWSKATMTHIWGEAFGRNASQKAASDAAARGLFQRTFGHEFDWMFQKEPCFSTSTDDGLGNKGSSGCQ